MLPMPIKWLKMIGKENREMLRHFYFYDKNPTQDRYKFGKFEKMRGCEIFDAEGMAGNLETLSSVHCAAHLVKFGSWERKEGEVPVALEPGAKRLRMVGEV